jgi:hypothetical protein
LDNANKPHLSYSEMVSGHTQLKYAKNTTGSWTTEAVDNATSTHEKGAFSSLALDSSNNVFMTYLYNDSTTDYLHESSGTAGSFSSGSIATLAATGSLKDSSIAVDNAATNVVHLLYTYLTGGHWALRYTTNAGGWGGVIDETPNNLPGSCAEYLYATAFTDSNNKIHASYLCVTAGGACQIYYAERTTGSWTHTQIGTAKAASCTIGGTSEAQAPSLALDSSNKGHVAYVDIDNGNLMYVTNSSGSWVAAATIDNSANIHGDAALALDVDGKPYVLYTNATGSLKMATKNSGTWNVESSIDSNVSGVGTAAVTGVKGRSNH